MTARPVARFNIRISIRLRILLAFTVIYTVFFTLSMLWASSFIERIIRQNAPAVLGASATPALVQGIVDHARVEIQLAAPIGFLVSYILLFLVTLAVDHGLSRPLIALSRYAKRVAEGDYATFVLPQAPFFHDEVSDLAESFSLMVDRVHGRETALKQQVAQLQIVVDNERKAKQVGEIVESEFFASLKARAHELRQASESGTVHKTLEQPPITPFTPPTSETPKGVERMPDI
jgi:HAMP domain-containing protein